jgi:hypothetical protein
MAATNKYQAHTNIILKRYADRDNIQYRITPSEVVDKLYLSKVIDRAAFKDKVILEIGAGGSQYARLFLESGCKRYYANDIIPERLKANGITDVRYEELPGDFLEIMFIIPMLEDFIVKIGDSLNPNGLFLSMDPNCICPLSIYRRYAIKTNPTRLFNPFTNARKFRKHGFVVESLIPFTANYPSVTGNWLLGTNFWIKARKL